MEIESDDRKMDEVKVRRYKNFLTCALCGSIVLLAVCIYCNCYALVPSHLKVRAGMEQTLEFGVPVTGEFTRKNEYPEAIAVSEQSESEALPASISMEMHKSVTVYALNPETYQLQLKLFGVIPFKQVEVEVIEDERLIPAGIPIGIYVKTEGVLVIGVGEFKKNDGSNTSPSRYLLKAGDYILKADGQEIEGKADFMKKVAESGGREMVLTIKRGEEVFEVKSLPELNENGEYKLGIWIRDNAQGVGTLTFLDEEGGFGALGHGINDVDTSELLELESGTLYHTEIIAIRKGVSGSPGEMTGMIDYTEENILGDITANRAEGIFGTGNARLWDEVAGEALPIALKQELHTGEAKILCTIDGYRDYYDIEITDLHLDHDNVNRGILLEITDSRLLEKTGGIIQGMSGAPILQDGRIVGAVTHVLVQDAAKGYGIFIENMLMQ